MEWLNKHNLSERVIRVLKGKYKERKPELNRLSITDLIDEPLPRILFINHWDSIVRDYSDLLTMVQGTSLHDRYEMCATDDEDAEHKFEDVVDGIIVVGKADSYFDNTILDVKQTACYGPKYRIDKWTKQLNCYAWQRRKRGDIVDKLLIDVWYRDWKLGNVFWKDYPLIPYECIELDLWDFEIQDKYIQDRVKVHLEHPVYDNTAEYITSCSNKQRGIRYEAYKGKNKTPTKVEDSLKELEKWVAINYKYKFRVVESEPVFCVKYCRSRNVCPFVKEL